MYLIALPVSCHFDQEEMYFGSFLLPHNAQIYTWEPVVVHPPKVVVHPTMVVIHPPNQIVVFEGCSSEFYTVRSTEVQIDECSDQNSRTVKLSSL